MALPRKEYPRPQFVRSQWCNLNGEWQFAVDNTRSGLSKGWHHVGVTLPETIIVPFCPESKLSGIGNTDFMNAVWYKRHVTIASPISKTRLHFGAVDYACKVFVNGKEMGEHKGGYSSFYVDITDALQVGENEITVYAEDDTRDRMIPSGKQSSVFHSWGCYYTRTTGIWQTVWLEFLPSSHIERVEFTPDRCNGSVTVQAELCGKAALLCEVFYKGAVMGSHRIDSAHGRVTFTVPLAEMHLWEPGHGRLYDVTFTFGEDTVESYFGVRDVSFDGNRFLLNGKSVFQRLVLDQGFYPDGIYTAPTDEALKRDIELSTAVGFNGARLHEKVFEERFLYHADRMGYLVWGEYPDWGLDWSRPENIYAILPEWMQVVKRDINHPCIIGWCPHNETWDQDYRKQCDDSIAMVYDVTKLLDPTRPCIDTSGNYHVKTDVFDLHDYEQNPEVFRKRWDRFRQEGILEDPFKDRQTYRGEPVFVSEYGGIRWAAGQKDETLRESWGYGDDPENSEAFYVRFKGLTDALLDNDRLFGLCYTQLTDVEQEQNGIYTYDRQAKFDSQRLKTILSRKAAIEE